jgi:hypothetical protein
MKGAAFLAVAAAVATLTGAVGCSGPDPGAVIYNPARGGGSQITAPPGATAPPAPTTMNPIGGPDAGGKGAPDAVAPLGEAGLGEGGVDAAALGVFANAPPYTSSLPGTSAAQNHALHGVGTTPNKDVDCLSCHNGATATQFLYAGSIYTDVGAATGAADVELRVVDANNVNLSAHSDADGNFWLINNGTLAVPGHAGARDGKGDMQLMPSAVQSGSCNGCHNGNVTSPLHLP